MRLAFALAASFLGAAAPLGAECRSSSSGAPGVGLVLSGGGARGLAHVGVLAVLEEEGIAVDCVAGTSMGAAIGALWAAGYSAPEIAEIVQSIDWQEVFSGRRVRSLVPLSRRIDDVPPAIRLRVDGLRPRLPPARDSDYRLNRLLFRLLAVRGFAAGGDFDRLPVPFRTVATDLATVQPVVLSRGSLTRAVRASMSPPIALPTIEIAGRVLVDGGIVDNVPVGIAREMGAGVVIAVDVTSPRLPREAWGDIVGAGRQLIDALMRDHARSWARAADLVVTPDLEGRGAEDFSDPDRLVEAGRVAARAALPRLRAIAPARGRHPAAAAPPVFVSEVVVRGADRVSPRLLRAAFGQHAQAPLEMDRILGGFDRVWATGLFEALWLDLEPADGGARVVLEVRETPPAGIEVGWAYDEADEVNAFTRLRHRNLFGHGERLDVTLLGGARDSGATVRLRGEGPWRTAVGYLLGGELREERPALYEDGREVGRAAFSRDFALAGGQVSFGTDVLVQAWAEAGRVRTEERRGISAERVDPHRMLKGLVAWDRLDDRDLPESGLAVAVRAERSLRGLEGVRDYWRLHADGRAAIRPGGGPVVLEAAMRAGLSGRDVPDYDLHRIGGPRFLPGHAREELWGRQVLGLSASVGGDVRGFRVSLEGGGGGAWSRRGEVSLGGLRWGAGIGVARGTRVGPLVLQVGVDEDGRGAVYLSAGRR